MRLSPVERRALRSNAINTTITTANNAIAPTRIVLLGNLDSSFVTALFFNSGERDALVSTFDFTVAAAISFVTVDAATFVSLGFITTSGVGMFVA